MKKYTILLLAISFLVLTGFGPCAAPSPVGPNLVVTDVTVDKDEQGKKFVSPTVANVGNRDAGPHHTYIEINEAGAPDDEKPQSWYPAEVSGITAGSSWTSVIYFSDFSAPHVDLDALPIHNVVVRVDAKNQVEETNENDNIYDANH
ncbi:MAG: hypothetical protein AMJ70_00470 [Dehalococcoidia bacterium SG8_51_3]|uniref:CARDB domain-containing protein n=1 Tax=candidate division WOR_3 bacterium SM23_42 TaxID=1703779 RepID=A0A0S8FMZ8_UNCW3|nr:MAG: hypothetical protein AMJ70_00470 [Dehalococcoidia bacterium SG8_51_3]KPK62095.1 MAG: hypothetical protein AMJ83_11630 [candidate division WOR_3 bacterium SM23_42]